MQVNSIAEQLFFTTIRIDAVTTNGDNCSGTGFFFMHKVGGLGYPFIVTNKHVVMGMREGSLSFLKHKDGLPTLGDGFKLKIDSQEWAQLWFGHPDQNVDIAICAIEPLVKFVKHHHGVDFFLRYVGTEHIPNEQQVKDLDAIESVTFIGYPNGIWDSVNLLPVARRGTTASPIEVDFERTPCFLIDASVFGGSSGSPVFILNQGYWAPKNGGFDTASRMYFVGVIASVFFRTQLNQVVAVPIPTRTQPMAEQREMIDLGIVFKARTVVETINVFLIANGVDVLALPQPALPEPVQQT